MGLSCKKWGGFKENLWKREIYTQNQDIWNFWWHIPKNKVRKIQTHTGHLEKNQRLKSVNDGRTRTGMIVRRSASDNNFQKTMTYTKIKPQSVQISILETKLLLIFINQLHDVINSLCKWLKYLLQS